MMKKILLLFFVLLSAVSWSYSDIASGSFVDLGTQSEQESINCFARCLNGNLLAGTASDGKILLSTDTGLIWNDLGQQATQTSITCITCLENGIVLAGTATEGHILRSIDNGETWTDLGQIATDPLAVTTINCITYCGNGIVLAGSNYGLLFRSADSGETWTNLGEQYSSENVISLGYLGSATVMMGTREPATLHRSTDGGLTWSTITYYSEGSSPDHAIVSFLPPIRDRCYAFGDNGEIYWSANYGLSWEDDSTVSKTVTFAKYFSRDIKILGCDDGTIARYYAPYIAEYEWKTIASPTENIIAGIYAGAGISIFGTATQGKILRHVASLPNELYSVTTPSDWSPGAIATWTTQTKHPRILVGTSTPDPRFGEIGDIFIKRSAAQTFPASQSEYLDDAGARVFVLSNWDYSNTNLTHDNVWIGIGKGGDLDHSALSNLTFELSGHSGFAAQAGSTTIDFNALNFYENSTLLSEKYAAQAGSTTVDFNARYFYGNNLYLGNGLLYYNSTNIGFEYSDTDASDYTKFAHGIPPTGQTFFVMTGEDRNLTIASDSVDLASNSFGIFPKNYFGIYRKNGYMPGSITQDTLLEMNMSTGNIIATGSFRAGSFVASDSTAGATEDVEIPFEYNVSTTTLHFKDGLYVGKN